MPLTNIQKELKALKVNKKINILKSFIADNKSIKLSDLITPDFALSEELSYIKEELDSLKILETTANRIFNSEQLVLDIEAKIKEIRTNYLSLAKENDSFRKLAAVKNSLEIEIKKTKETRNESVISKAEEELKTQTILVLKQQLKGNKENFPAAIELDNLTSKDLLCIARYFWLKEQCKENSNAKDIENLIKEKINTQAKTDVTGSSLPVSGNITLLDLARIKDWNNFKFNFEKQLKELRSKENEGATPNNTSEALNKENSNLLKEVNELKLKITSLETELSLAYSDFEKHKTILSPNEPVYSNSEEFNSLKEQNDEEITNLNKQLFAATEKNEQLTAEMGTNKELNEKQQQTIFNLNSELENLKISLEVKEKQVSENLNTLEQKKGEILLATNKLQKKKQALEASKGENEKLSDNLTKLSSALTKKKQALNDAEKTLNELKIEHNQIQLLKTDLESKLEHTELYNSGLLRLKEEEITKINSELEKLNSQLAAKKDELDSNSSTNSRKVSDLETTIQERNSSLEQLINELKNLQENEKTFEKAAEDLEIKLAEKSKQLTDKDEQFQILTNQFSHLSTRKEELERNYQTQLTEYDVLKTKYNSDINKLEESLAIFKEKTKFSESEAAELKIKVHNLGTNLKEEKNTLSQTTEEIAKLRTDYSSLKTQLTTAEQIFNTKLTTIEEQKRTLNEELDEVTEAHSLFIERATKALVNISPPNYYLSSIASESVKEKELEEIFQKIAFLNKQVIEKNNAIKDLQHELADLKAESFKKDEKILTLEETPITFGDNSPEELTFSPQAFENPNLEPIPQRFNINEDFDDLEDAINEETNSDDGDDDRFVGYLSGGCNAEFDPNILLAKRLESTEKLVADKEAELAQKTDELEQLQSQLLAKETEVKNLKTKAQKDVDDLVKQVTETQERFNESQDQMTVLKAEQAEELMKKDVSSEQILANQKKELDELKAKHENSIQELNNQITDKGANLEALSLKLTTADQQVQEHKKTINSLEAEKLILKNQIKELEQKNGELQQKLDQASATKDTLLTELQQEKISNEEKLQQLRNQLKDLEETLESNRKDYSNSKTDYDNLKKALEEKNQELNLIKNTLETSKAELEIANEETKNLKAKLTNASQIIQEKLSSLKEKEGPMKDVEVTPQFNKPFDQDKFDPFFVNPPDFKNDPSINRSDSSSGHGSRNSLSSDSNKDENILSFLANPKEIPQQTSSSDEAFSDGSEPRIQNEPNLMQFSDEEDLDLSETEDELDTDSKAIPVTTSIPTTEPQRREATPEEIKQGVNAAFQPENHPAIVEAFTKKFLRIASHAANTFFNDGTYSNELPDFKDKLQEISDNEVKGLVNALFKNESLQSSICENIHNKGLSQSTYLDEIKHSASLIFDNLIIKQQNKNDQNYKDYISGKANDLLIKLCIENLRANEREQLIDLAKNNLEDQATDNNLQITEYTEIIQNSAEELVTKLLKPSNLQNTLEEMAKHPIVDLNLLDASKRKLQDQVEQQINQNVDHYFPNLQLDPILEKLNDSKPLSDDEIAKFPSVLQFADTIAEFVSGLRVEYPNLASGYESNINEDAFKQLRLTLRENTLNAISQTLSNDISDLNSKEWLEYQLQLITGKSVDLEQIQLEKNQKNLLNELDTALQLSTFYDISLTPKSITELKAELKKFNQAQLAAVAEKNKLFSEIENQQIHYPSLMPDENAIKGFRGNINQYLDNLSLEAWQINDEEAKILLTGINQRLKKDLSKWGLLDSKLYTEITDTILNIADENSFKFGNDVNEKRKIIEEIVKHGLTILRKNYPNNTFQKRDSWLKNTTLLYAATQKLQKFSSEIANRKIKIENLLDLKERKDHEVRTATVNTSATYQGIFLPHNCIVIADTCDPNLEKPIDSEYTMLPNSFYSKDAMRTGQTITFEQKLSNGNNREWSVTKDATSLSYNTGSSWVDRLKNVGGRIRNKIDPFNSTQLSAEDKQVVFAAFSHAIASSKGSVLTLSIGANCSKEKETYIRLLIEDFNKNQRNGQKTSILINNNDKLKVHTETKTVIQEEIKNKTSPSKELDNVASQSNKITQNIRSRGL
ncbi:MAG: hypothetical protein RLY40_429 [Pseudomonadota bacterium]|jgi:chromosome segregation ATPase